MVTKSLPDTSSAFFVFWLIALFTSLRLASSAYLAATPQFAPHTFDTNEGSCLVIFNQLSLASYSVMLFPSSFMQTEEHYHSYLLVYSSVLLGRNDQNHFLVHRCTALAVWWLRDPSFIADKSGTGRGIICATAGQ